MANQSIFAAFERMWQHVTSALSTKSDASHAHDDIYYTKQEVDTAITNVDIDLDTELTESGKAADAKAVGDAINEISKNTVDKINYIDTWLNDNPIGLTDEGNGIVWNEGFYIETEDGNYECEITHKVPISAGENITFTVDESTNVIKINGVQSQAQLQTPITHSELVALRDNSQLIPGMLYRITDYVCTTAQDDTRAMDNKFDIIIQALSTNTLSENASADYHMSQDTIIGEGSTFKPEVLADADGVLVDGAVIKYYDIYEDCDDLENKTENYKIDDTFVEYGYLENNEGVVVPVLYKNDLEAFADEGADYADVFYYVGTYELNGTTYDKWRKIESGDYGWGGTGKIYALTNVIVDGVFGQDYFKNANLHAWEIKYCLDNDTTRFAWADNAQAITNLESLYSDGQPLTRQPNFDGAMSNAEGYEEYYYAWGTQADVDDDDPPNFWYSKNEVLFNGETMIKGDGGVLAQATVIDIGGKGVIYYMKDEFNNECPYDFKNIQFKRYMITETDKDSLGNLVGHYFGTTGGNGYTIDEEDYKWCYTFSWLNENDEIEDLSIIGHTLPNDEERYTGIYNNVINTVSEYTKSYTESQQSYAIALNDIVFLSEWGCDDGFFFGCHSNTFGNECYSNTFCNKCYYNTFGHYCHSNTFGSHSYYNTFGSSCSYNTFGDYFSSNTFGNDCRHNTFGNFYGFNTFGNDCYANTVNGDNIKYIEVGSGVISATITPEPNACYQQIYRKSGSKEILI